MFGRFVTDDDVRRVQAEQFPPLAAVVRESFTRPEHRAMLARHEAETIRFESRELQASIRGDVFGWNRLNVALIESLAYTAEHPEDGSPPISVTLALARAKVAS